MTASDFNTQFQAYNGPLQAFAYRLTNDMERAKDLLQETAYRAFKNKDRFQQNTNLKAWLMTIMKNIFINDYRRRAKHTTIFDSTDNQYYLNSGKQTVRNGAGTNIMMDELTEIIEELDESIRIPFLMHYKGYKYQEIAEHFELPLGTVKSRIFFARRELKGRIRKLYQITSAEKA